MSHESETVPVAEAAHRLLVSPEWVYKMVSLGRLRATRQEVRASCFGGRAHRTRQVIRVCVDSMHEYLTRRCQTPQATRGHREGCACRFCQPKQPRVHAVTCGCVSCTGSRNSEGLTERLEVCLTPDHVQRINRAAAAMNLTRSELIRTAVECYLEDC